MEASRHSSVGAGGLAVCVACAWGTVTLRAVPGAGNPRLHLGQVRAEPAPLLPLRNIRGEDGSKENLCSLLRLRC